MNLYKIQPDASTPPLFFDTKREAKNCREELRDDGKKNIVIMRGPDHWRGESFNVTHSTRKTRKTW